MNPDQLSSLQRYETLKLEIKEREEELERLKPVVLPLIPEDKELLTEKGYFYIQNRPTWTFTKSVEDHEKELKKMKAQEKARGIATSVDVPTLYYAVGRPKPRPETE